MNIVVFFESMTLRNLGVAVHVWPEGCGNDGLALKVLI